MALYSAEKTLPRITASYSIVNASVNQVTVLGAALLMLLVPPLVEVV